MKIPKIILTTTMAAALTACGGGGGDAAPIADSTAKPTTIPAVVIATPASPVGTPADAGTAGTLPILTFTNLGETSTQNVTISGTGTASVMTFSSPAFTLTGATSSSPVWSTNGGGMTKADGNVLVYCSAGQTSFSTNPSTLVLSQQGARVFISANLTAVSDVALLRGNTYNEFDCAGSKATNRFNADGTVALTNSDGSVYTFTATQVAQLFTVNGFTGPGGSNYKSRAYKYTIAGVGSRYFISTTVTQVNPSANFVTLGY